MEEREGGREERKSHAPVSLPLLEATLPWGFVVVAKNLFLPLPTAFDPFLCFILNEIPVFVLRKNSPNIGIWKCELRMQFVAYFFSYRYFVAPRKGKVLSVIQWDSLTSLPACSLVFLTQKGATAWALAQAESSGKKSGEKGLPGSPFPPPRESTKEWE